jgi:hypothetical protein
MGFKMLMLLIGDPKIIRMDLAIGRAAVGVRALAVVVVAIQPLQTAKMFQQALQVVYRTPRRVEEAVIRAVVTRERTSISIRRRIINTSTA